MTRDEETRLWIKTHLQQIERPEEVEDYLRAYRYLDSRRDEITQDAEIEVHGGVGWLRRGTSVIAVPDHWHDGDKVTVRISKINENENDNENRLKMKDINKAARDYAILPMDVGDGKVCIDRKQESAFKEGAEYVLHAFEHWATGLWNGYQDIDKPFHYGFQVADDIKKRCIPMLRGERKDS